MRTSFYCLLLWAALPSPRAFASDPPHKLAWEAPLGCPTASDVRALLAKSQRDLRKLAVHGRIRADSGQLMLELRVASDRQHFERTLRSADCQLLAQSAVWLIGLASEQMASATTRSRAKSEAAPSTAQTAASLREVTPGSAEPATREEQTALTSASAAGETTQVYLDHTAPSVTHAQAPSRSRDGQAANFKLATSVGLGIAGVGLTGPATDLSIAVAASAGAFYASLRAGTVLHPSLELEPQAQLSFHSAYIEFAACDDLRSARLRTGPCVVLDGWATFVGQRGLRNAQDATAFWLNAGGAWHVLVSLHQAVQLSLDLGVTVGLGARPTLAVSGMHVSQIAPVAGYARIGYGFAYW